MSHIEQHLLRARMADLDGAVAFVAGFCASRGIGQSDRLRLTLMVEELFTNTVGHGHGGDADAAVRLALHDDGAGQVELFYEDQAPAFNPLDRVADTPAVEPDDLETLRPGGLGIALMLRIAASARYAYEDGCNRLWLTLRHQG